MDITNDAGSPPSSSMAEIYQRLNSTDPADALYEYRPLQDPAQIRLLRLKTPDWDLEEIPLIETELTTFLLAKELPHRSESTIQTHTTSQTCLELGDVTDNPGCSNLDVSLAPSYTALSYRWGDEKRPLDSLFCEGRFISISYNLFHALKQLLEFADRPEWLWVDAVCINQKNATERSHQVANMSKIYSNAQSVWVSLKATPLESEEDSWDNKETYLVDDVMNEMMDTLTEWVNDKKKSAGLADEDEEDHNRHTHTFLQAPIDVFDTIEDSKLQAISDFFHCEWWERAWIVQEVGLAQSIVVLYNQEALRWEEIQKFCHDMAIHASIPCFGMLSDRFCHALSISTAYGDVDWEWDFLDVMLATRNTFASEAVDNIYAFLSHDYASLNGKPLIVPDYTRPVRDVFLDFTKALIEVVGLRVLTRVNLALGDNFDLDELKSLPSWVPRWDWIDECFPIGGRSSHMGLFDDPDILPDPKRCFKICEERLMCIALAVWDIKFKTSVFEAPQEIGESLEDQDLKIDWFGKLLRDLPGDQSADNEWISGGQKDCIISLAAALTAGQTSLTQVITAGSSTSTPLVMLSDLEQRKYLLDFIDWLQHYPVSTQALFDNIKQLGCQDVLDMERWKQELSTMGHSKAEEGDHVEKILEKGEEMKNIQQLESDCKNHLLGDFLKFQRDMTTACNGRCFFVLGSGLYGIGPSSMEEGDICAIIVGIITPMILRIVEKGASSTVVRIIGEAYVHKLAMGQEDIVYVDDREQDSDRGCLIEII
jgi:hypothetical protein